MGRQTITIAIPEETYEPFRQHAERARQSVEDAVVEAMRAALVDGDEASAEGRQATLAALALLDTSTLWQMVQRGAENEDVLLLAALNEKRQRQALTEAEESVVRDLIRRHDRAVLLRAKALALLRQRGEDVSALVGGA
jgi:hypothetical protein